MAGLFANLTEAKATAKCVVATEDEDTVGFFLLQQAMRRNGTLRPIKVRGVFANLPEQEEEDYSIQLFGEAKCSGKGGDIESIRHRTSRRQQGWTTFRTKLAEGYEPLDDMNGYSIQLQDDKSGEISCCNIMVDGQEDETDD